ncbi:MAG: hypothetical protein ABJB05_04635 [Parafilimonas sp.]
MNQKVSLTDITKHLDITSAEEQKMLDALHQQLSSALIDNEITALKGVSFSHENTNFFANAQQDVKASNAAAESISAPKENPSHKVFIRDTPIRNAQVKTSVPQWAVGAAVDKTIGPFINKDGRRLWYDFYPIEELIALYVQGNANPVLLFHTSVFRRLFENIPFVNQSMTSYQLNGNTIWINAQVLSHDAPSGFYTGLKIKTGEITLTEAPQSTDNKLTVGTSVTISVKLQLDEPGVTNADATSDYGKDARAASVNLPQQFNFSFSGNTAAKAELVADASWSLYGSQAGFTWNANVPISFDAVLNEILVPLNCSEQDFSILNNLSAFNILSGKANIEWSAWTLPVAQIDINNPIAAEGTGALTIRCDAGISAQWAGMKNGVAILSNPYIQLNVGKISVLEFAALNIFSTQQFLLWKDAINPHRSSVELFYNAPFPLLFLSDVAGSEMIIAQTNSVAHIDRPVTVDAQPLDIQTKNSLLFIIASKTTRLLYLYDDNILADNTGYTIAYFPQPISFALQNAVFKTTKTNGFLLFGALAENFINVEPANLILSFGIYAYLPILPDPYAANLGVLKEQFSYYSRIAGVSDAYQNRNNQQVWLMLICSIKWVKENDDSDNVDVSFSFAPLPQQAVAYSAVSFDKRINNLNATTQPFIQNNAFIQQFQSNENNGENASNNNISGTTFQTEMFQQQGLPDYQSEWDDNYSFFQNDMFALLDVSSRANQMGISFQPLYSREGNIAGERLEMYKTYEVAATTDNNFPLQIEGMNVVAQNRNVKAFTLPQLSWEPVINLTPPQKAGDPPALFNYYPDDGGATRLFNNSVQFVPVAPIPVTNALVHSFHNDEKNILGALFTLPFGIRAFATLDKTSQNPSPNIVENRPSFNNKLRGGIQLSLTGGASGNPDVSNQFHGATLQINNVLNILGAKTNASTLGYDVTTIFNGEFYFQDADKSSVPLTRFDLSGYGASIFSNWQDKDAEFATTSQAEFEVFVGRTAHEVIQVKSVIYPWGIHVVRTISLFRTSSGYEYRYDSGWKAEGDGKFDFRFHVVTNGSTDPDTIVTDIKMPYQIHPGTIKGLYNIKNIIAANSDVAPFKTSMDITGFYEYNAFSKYTYPYNGAASPVDVDLEPVYFDADIDIENTIQGQVNGRVPSKKILGFVQVAPTGIPLTPTAFAELLNYQNGSIGGAVNCIVDIGMNSQQLRVNRIDINISADASNTNPVFVAAARGNAILPKEGSWSMVTHLAKTGEVTPLPTSITVPLIRIGELDINLNYPVNGLLRIANPTELLRLPSTGTINYGFLQSTNTQKVLFLTPAYQTIAKTATGKLLSKTPPLFADAYHLMNTKGIFPNIGDAVNNYGDVVALSSNFVSNAATDAGKQLLELMQVNIKDVAGNILQQGFQLLKQNVTAPFDLNIPDFYFVNTDPLKIYVQYNADVRNENPLATNADGSPDYNGASNFNNAAGALNFDVNSFAADTADKWKSKMNNISMAVDLGPFKKLVTIKGNFNAQNGSDAAYAGNDDASENFPSPQLQFCDALNPVMDILQVLVSLQGGNYAAALKKGLQIAMSNDADSWQYKFDASQEIPLIEFPSDVLAGASAPLKLQASLKFGVYFNEALKVTTNPSQLLPTAGAFLEFYGKLSVMCVSLEIATVYAVGSVDLKLAADTSVGPSLTMKFGFGAQIVIGLPVVGNVSILYMIGVNVYMDSQTQTVGASLLYQGRADLLGGIIDITITIEAQGNISRSNGKTTCEAQVTFAIDISICFVIDIDFSKSWSEQRQIA